MGRAALVVLALLALVVMIASTTVAGFIGSDDTVYNRPSELGADGRPVLTAPDLLAYEHVIVTLRASAPGGVFIGTAHPVDVADFVGDSPRIRLTSVTRTGVEAEDVGSAKRVEPAAAGFWTSSMSGSGVEELALDRDASANQWVIAPLDGVGPTTISFGITVEGTFRAALVALGTATVVLVLCVELLLRGRRRRRRAPTAAERISPFVSEVTEPTPRPAPGRRRASRLALALALGASLAGCGYGYDDLVPTQRQSSDLATTKAALTRDELPALLESYDARLRAAIKAARPPRYRSEKWRLADRGPALESDLFGTRVTELTQLGRRAVPTHDGVQVFSGRFEAYPMWSMVGSQVGDDTRLDLFTKASVEAPWLRRSGSVVVGDLPRPGEPSDLPSSDRVADAAAAWRAYLRTGDSGGGLQPDKVSRQWRDNIADLGSRAMFRGFDVKVQAADPTRVVRVADGVLAIVALRVTTRLDGRPDLRVRWAPPYGKYRPVEDGELSFADLAIGIVHLPSKGAPTLLGSTFSEVAVRP